MKSIINKILILTTLLISTNSCIKKSNFIKDDIFAMGTIVSIFYEKNDQKIVKNAIPIFNHWITTLDTDINKINATPINATVDNLSDDTKNLLKLATKYYHLTNGEYDITLYTLTRLYGFNSTKSIAPTKNEIEHAKNNIGFKNLIIKDDTLIKLKDVKIDLSATGKGYLVDKLSNYFLSHGMKNFIINAGGDIYISGKKSNSSLFRVGIRSPINQNSIVAELELEDKAVATSGGYERFFITNSGRKLNHIFSGKTLESVDNYQSVSVIADTAEIADSFATIFYLLDIENIKTLCNKYSLPTLIIDNNDTELMLCNFKQYNLSN